MQDGGILRTPDTVAPRPKAQMKNRDHGNQHYRPSKPLSLGAIFRPGIVSGRMGQLKYGGNPASCGKDLKPVDCSWSSESALPPPGATAASGLGKRSARPDLFLLFLTFVPPGQRQLLTMECFFVRRGSGNSALQHSRQHPRKVATDRFAPHGCRFGRRNRPLTEPEGVFRTGRKLSSGVFALSRPSPQTPHQPASAKMTVAGACAPPRPFFAHGHTGPSGYRRWKATAFRMGVHGSPD